MKKLWVCLLGLTALVLSTSFASAEWTWEKHTVEYDLNGAIAMDVADLNHDGTLDIIAGGYQGDEIRWYNGAADFAANTLASGYDIYGLDVVDVDGDGDLDVVTASTAASDVSWWENDGNQVFTQHSIDAALGGAQRVLAVDLDEDGDMDVVAAGYTGNELIWYENDGDENFTDHSLDSSYNNAYGIFVVDLDQDNDLDIISTARADGDMDWWENDGAENFTKHSISIGINYPSGVTAADFDKDGDIDIALAEGGGDFSWWENNGSQSFTRNAIFLDRDNPRNIQAADLDNDGDMDLVATDDSDNFINVFYNNGVGNFKLQVAAGYVYGASDVQVADLDKDGQLDIVATAYQADDVVWLEAHNADSLTVVSSNQGLTSKSVLLSGNTLYLGTQNEARVQIFNVTSPATPSLLGEYNPEPVDTFNPAQQLGMAGGYLYSVNRKGYMLEAINVSTPSAPVQACNNTVTSNAGGLAIRGEYAFVGDNDGYIYVMHLQTPTYMGVSTTVDVGGGIKGLALYNTNTLLATDTNNYLHLLDVTNPYSPGMLASVTLTAAPQDVAVSGNYAYVACMEQGVQIYDISTPTAPSLVSQYVPEGYTQSVTVIGTYAYVGTGTNWYDYVPCGLYMLNIYNPANPYLERQYVWNSGIAGEDLDQGVREVAVSGNYILAASSQGLMVFSTNALPTATPTPDYSHNTPTPTPKIDSITEQLKGVLAYPNPAQDVVTFIFEDDRCDNVRIDIFNMTGERVAKLEQASPGRTMTWQAGAMSPGIYLYQTVITRNGVEEKLPIKKLAIAK